MALPRLVLSDARGRIREHPDLEMAGASGRAIARPSERELIPLPEGSELFHLPGRTPVGWDPALGRETVLLEVPGGPRRTLSPVAVAAFIAPAYMRLYNAAYLTTEVAPRLPLFAYAPVGWRDGRFWTTAMRVDPDPRQDHANFDRRRLPGLVRRRLKQLPGNRLAEHLAHCALVYGCPGAKNLFHGRWEAPLPTAPACNARCVGCLSLQPPDAGFPATQDRITFVPTVEEIAALAVPHLETAERPVVSFGQGCEGEPLTQGPLLEEAIRAIRRRTRRGTINLNTNGSRSDIVERLCAAGLDAIRVSLNSLRAALYEAYYRPVDYTFADAVESIRVVVRAGRFASINLLVFPGVTDTEEEAAALVDLVRSTGLQMIQLRNLNIDPDLYLALLGPLDSGRPLGMRSLLDLLRREFPRLRLGYFNPCLDAGLPGR